MSTRVAARPDILGLQGGAVPHSDTLPSPPAPTLSHGPRVHEAEVASVGRAGWMMQGDTAGLRLRLQGPSSVRVGGWVGGSVCTRCHCLSRPLCHLSGLLAATFC